MPEAREIHSIVQAAEQAAGAGDYAAAEVCLREAARLQEEILGPLHPDLANTLNNLGVACDITNKPDEAEHCYRRAHAIAIAVLPPDHQFVATSEKNLRDFCQARGRPFETRPSPPPADVERQPQVSGPPDVPGGDARRADTPRTESRRAESLPSESPKRGQSIPFRWLAIAAVLGFLLMLAVLIVAGQRPESSVPTGSHSQSVNGSSEGPAASDAERVASEPAREPRGPSANGSGVGEERNDRAMSRSSGTSLTVVEAGLCRNLSTVDWRCEPVDSPVGPGPMFLYTRIKSPRNTTVEHRWYVGDRLYQAVELDVQANPSNGYRTFSRNTVDAQNTGEWRVELRTRDGILLHEERFTAR